MGTPPPRAPPSLRPATPERHAIEAAILGILTYIKSRVKRVVLPASDGLETAPLNAP